LRRSLPRTRPRGDGEPPPEEIDHFRELIREQAPSNPADVQAAASDLENVAEGPEKARALDAALRLERAELFSADSEDVREAEREIVPHLRRNPRDIKRFDNAFRLQLHVANGTPGCDLDFDLDDLVALGKWVALRLRWPDLADAIDRDSGLLERLEAAGTDGGPLERADAAWIKDDELAALLRDPQPRRRVARLGTQTFLRVS
jgi:hypothetical protein